MYVYIVAMEFRFRADENGASKPSTYIPQSSTNTFFTEHALTAGVLSANVRRPSMETNSLDVAEVILREMEKSRIREEIMMAEALRRHELEAEVRRELMIERAMMRSEGVSSFDSSMSSLQQSDLGGLPLHYQNGVGIGIGIGVEERLSMMSRPEVGSFQGLPFQQCRPVIQLLPELRNSLQPELKNLLPQPVLKNLLLPESKNFSLPEPKNLSSKNWLLPEVSNGQVLLAKPISINSNVAGIKRKAETIANAGGDETPSISASKKPQKGWRCNLCRVSTTCERGLNDHLRGRKHKAKEALLRASKTVSLMTSNSYPFPEESEMSTELAVPTGSLNPNQGERPKGNQEVMEYRNAVVQKMQNTGDLKINGKLLLDKSQQQLKFWCQMCNFGTNSETLMEDHQNGKTHMNLLLKNGGAVIAISTVPEHVQKIEAIVAKGATEDGLLDQAQETDETVAAQETKETAGLEGENADGDKLASTNDNNNDVPLSTMELI